MPACCIALEKAIKDKALAFDGAGWHINGCCGQCFILSAVSFCPFCAAALPARKRATPGAGKTLKGKKQKARLHNQPTLISTIE